MRRRGSGSWRLEPPVEPENREDALLLAELLGVGAAIPAVAGEVAAVGDILHAEEYIERLPAHGEGAVHAYVDAAVIRRSLRVDAREVIDAASLFRGHRLVIRRERSSRQKRQP